MGLINIIAILFILWSEVKTCPPAGEISPHCACNKESNGNVMSCYNLLSSDDLDIPIKAASRRNVKLYALKIYNSSFLFIPSNIFQHIHIQMIHFIQSDVMSLSDTDVAFKGLENTLNELSTSGCKYVEHWDWTHLLNLTVLDRIIVNSTTLQSIDKPFPPLPELTVIRFVDTKLSFIVDNAFRELGNLMDLTLPLNDISELKRNMLPDPANVLYLIDLRFNKIAHLPEDFFSNMTQLQEVYLSFNKITSLSEMPFSVAFKVLQNLLMTDNPIRCDCRMRWIIDSRLPPLLDAYCSSPKLLAGKHIKDLDYKSLWC